MSAYYAPRLTIFTMSKLLPDDRPSNGAVLNEILLNVLQRDLTAQWPLSVCARCAHICLSAGQASRCD